MLHTKLTHTIDYRTPITLLICFLLSSPKAKAFVADPSAFASLIPVAAPTGGGGGGEEAEAAKEETKEESEEESDDDMGFGLFD